MTKQYGNTLLELLLVIAVSGVIVALGIRYFTVASMNARIAESISKIDLISRAGYQWLSLDRQPDFTKVQLQALIESELLRESDASNPWGGQIKVSAGGVDKTHLKITLENISSSACKNIHHNMKTIAYKQVASDQCQLEASGNHAIYWGEF